MPSIGTLCSTTRIASTAAPSAPFLSPRPIHRDAASAAASVPRTSPLARLRSGTCFSDAMGRDPTRRSVPAKSVACRYREPSVSDALAAVDVGTNSVHLVVARLGEGDHFDVLTREKEMVRLGTG